MNRPWIVLTSLLILTGCSRQEPPAVESSPATTPALTPTPAPVTPTATPTNPAAKPPPVEIGTLEQEYVRTDDIYTKLTVLTQIPDADPAAALGMLTRLFEQEDDPELREELLQSIHDIEGQSQAKLDFLTIALQPIQPETVRLTAIDLLVSLGHPDAIPILQNFLADPSPDIRQAIADAVEQLSPR